MKSVNPTPYSQLTRMEIRRHPCPRCGAAPRQLCDRSPADTGKSHRERVSVARHEAREFREATGLDGPPPVTAAQRRVVARLHGSLVAAGLPFPPAMSSASRASAWIDAAKRGLHDG